MGLIGPGGQPLGKQPVVAHIIAINQDNIPPEQAQATALHWQKTFGVPAIVVTGGVEPVAMVLADGTLQPMPLREDLAVKVFEFMADRTAAEAQLNQPGGADPSAN